jgi:hypothetical protein
MRRFCLKTLQWPCVSHCTQMSSQHVLENAFYQIEFAQPKRARDRHEENAYVLYRKTEDCTAEWISRTCASPQEQRPIQPCMPGNNGSAAYSANRDVRITPNEAPQCRSQNSGFKCLSVATRIWILIISNAKSGRPFDMFWTVPTAPNQLAKVLQSCSRGLQIHTNMPRCKMSQRRPQNKNEYTHAHQKID